MINSLIPRVILFRKEVVQLWHAFFAPQTPLYLKIATVLTALYLVSPFDIIPDVIPFIGWVDDIVLVPLMVSWIVSRLPVPVRADHRERNDRGPNRGGPTIDGRARRL
ncbi:YkvA family protein [Devosia aquimaris]|uniref:YkvA family protein n=1 Tax=Devosia aquimaris TaxID=2866214 RepID=UPI001CD15349|nr:YkvA family protein [Devosia sp. CJK-A8-3]